VPCRFESKASDGGCGRFTIPQLPTEVGPVADDADIAAALALTPAEIGFDGFVPARWSGGNPFTFVPVNGLAAVARCRIDPGKYEAAFADTAVYIFAKETVQAAHAFHARMFAPRLGVAEDPATGSAAAAFAGLIAARGALADGEHPVVIEQ